MSEYINYTTEIPNINENFEEALISNTHEVKEHLNSEEMRQEEIKDREHHQINVEDLIIENKENKENNFHIPPPEYSSKQLKSIKSTPNLRYNGNPDPKIKTRLTLLQKKRDNMRFSPVKFK